MVGRVCPGIILKVETIEISKGRDVEGQGKQSQGSSDIQPESLGGAIMEMGRPERSKI